MSLFPAIQACRDLLSAGSWEAALAQAKKNWDELPQVPQTRDDFARALNNWGVSVKQKGDYREALNAYDQALALVPTYVDALCNRGHVLRLLNRHEEAWLSYVKALQSKPAAAHLYSDMGLVLAEMGQLDLALAHYQRAIDLDQQHASAYMNASFSYLLQGQWKEGWSAYAWRERARAHAPRQWPVPQWAGQAVPAGSRILVHVEQGLGDAIQCLRYVPLLVQRGFVVMLEVLPALRNWCEGIPGIERLLPFGELWEPKPSFDWHCPILALPQAFETTEENIPSVLAGCLSSEMQSQWRTRLKAIQPQPRIGLVWRGNPKHKNDYNRSLSLEQCLAWFKLPVHWVVLQKDITPNEREILSSHSNVSLWDAELTDLSQTAAAIAELDIVVTVDTSVAHLAATLNKPTWIALSFHPDWRWQLERLDSPWYPSARLFRQKTLGVWNDVVRNIGQALWDKC